MNSSDFETGFMAGFLINRKKGGDTPTPTPAEWEYPSNWLQVPEPKDNEIIMLVENRAYAVRALKDYEGVEYSDGMSHVAYTSNYDVRLESDAESYIDWGDGTISRDEYHDYEPGSGTTVAVDEYGNVEQWIVKIVFDDSLGENEEYINSLFHTNYRNGLLHSQVLAFKIGNTKYSNTSMTIIFDNTMNTQYVKVCNGVSSQVFSDAKYLRKVELHDGITELPNSMCSGAYSLTDINLDNIVKIGNGCFYNCKSFDVSKCKTSNISEIGENAFNQSNISSFNFPLLTNVPAGAFSGCTNLSEIVINENVTNIGNYAFNNCYKLRAVGFPNVSTVGNYAFSSCYGLNSVELPSVTSIGTKVFSDSVNLTKIIVPSNYEIVSNEFYGCPNAVIERSTNDD